MNIIIGLLIYYHPTLNTWWMWVLFGFFWVAKMCWAVKTRNDINAIVKWIRLRGI